MILPLKIAFKYLFSRKTHNVINLISIVSAIAIGIGCMALIIILSVFNGFNHLVTNMYHNGAPDFVIESKSGKVLSLNDESIISLNNFLIDDSGSDATNDAMFVGVVEEFAYMQFNGTQCIGKLEGRSDQEEGAIVNLELANMLNIINPNIDSLNLFVPTRTSDISIAMPMQSINVERVEIIDIDYNEENKSEGGAIIPLYMAQQLLEYEEFEVNRIEIFLNGKKKREIFSEIVNEMIRGKDDEKISEKIDRNNDRKEEKEGEKNIKRIEKRIKKIVSEEFSVKNFQEQNSTIFKMMRGEKVAVYLILFFIIIIIAVNISSTIAMMIIDKRSDIKTYKSMGAKSSLLTKAFTLQGSLICIIGALVGLTIGLILCLLQQKFGIISLPGSFVTTTYPVNIKLSDIIIILSGVICISLLMSYIPTQIKKLFGEDSINS